jgi:pyrroloquinoline-quinone synthase
MTDIPWSRSVFTSNLQRIGSCAYHDKHPFHVLMNSGQLGKEALQTWVANRFYYQLNIPIKDAAILSNCPVREVRRLWLHRITDHDGVRGDEGGIGAWLRLGEACGLPRAGMLASQQVIPAVRFAVDAYVNFARSQPWPIAIASSLTELFAPDLMAQRLAAFEKFYGWIQPSGLEYFKSRLTQARRDSGEALELTLTYCQNREAQEAAVRALQFKCDLLWAMLDGIHLSTNALKHPHVLECATAATIFKSAPQSKAARQRRTPKKRSRTYSQ